MKASLLFEKMHTAMHATNAAIHTVNVEGIHLSTLSMLSLIIPFYPSIYPLPSLGMTKGADELFKNPIEYSNTNLNFLEC